MFPSLHTDQLFRSTGTPRRPVGSGGMAKPPQRNHGDQDSETPSSSSSDTAEETLKFKGKI